MNTNAGGPPLGGVPVDVITISREYGAGGRELAGRLSAALGWEVLDRELIHRAAALEELPDSEFERIDETPLSLGERFQLHPVHERYMRGLEEATRRAVAAGGVILVGRGTRQILGEVPGALHVRLEASLAWRAERIARVEGLDIERAMRTCAEEDAARGRFMRYYFGPRATSPTEYHLTVNCERVPLADVVACLAGAVRGDAPGPPGAGRRGRRVMTVTGERGAGDSAFAAALGERLGLEVFDRERIEREADRRGGRLADLGTEDEWQSTLLEWFLPGGGHARYREALERAIRELADSADAIFVGRGAGHVLRDDPRAFHVRLVAALSVRIRRVMEHHWLAEGPAGALVERADEHRKRFHEALFGIDWESPLGYDITIDTGRAGPLGAGLASCLAARRWARG